MLHKDISLNPSSFVEVLRMLFKPEGDEKLEKKETKDMKETTIFGRSNLAWDLLKSWQTIPGTNDDGSINYNILINWIKETKKLLTKFKRESAGLEVIGELFGRCNNDKSWPKESISKVIT